MYLFRKLSMHAGRIRIVQFMLAFKVQVLGWNHCPAVMALNSNNPERSLVEQ